MLLIGMAWTFGYVTFAVGHLNILSVSFAATLIGIGIDYGVHFTARYLKLREKVRTPRRSVADDDDRRWARRSSTGAITTAIAFFCRRTHDFTGVAELGIIAGGGILLCAVADAVRAAGRHSTRRSQRHRVSHAEPLPVHEWIEPLMAAAAAACSCRR